MNTALRAIAGVLAGLLVAFVLVVLVELFGSVVHPVPEGFGGTDEEMCLHVERIPPWVLAVSVPAWVLTAFAGTWVAQWIGNRYAAALVGLLVLAALIFNISMLPYPICFKIACLLAIPLAILVGMRLPMRPKTAVIAAGSA